ncbi:hypothetical protein X797_009867 [Metarhizium robertsii]|uniref:C6 transcription factor n=2 Tax=Metarhizium robertsii TaxID=568076 RepID=A0A0B2XE07_METRA|nr:C6 transcription factor [Metarhizium robertsii ARSEF 23]EXU97102.1 hypothetical protein X797_009867 [Metarhizium robertsii]KHO10980.1 C6 transcription factor [Metarhizium robertsii ARSEF 23]
MPDLKSYSVLSLDCYGTLVDWEAGMVEALGPSPSTFLPSLDTCGIDRKPNVLGGEVEDLEDGIASDFGGCCLTICVQQLSNGWWSCEWYFACWTLSGLCAHSLEQDSAERAVRIDEGDK